MRKLVTLLLLPLFLASCATTTADGRTPGQAVGDAAGDFLVELMICAISLGYLCDSDAKTETAAAPCHDEEAARRAREYLAAGDRAAARQQMKLAEQCPPGRQIRKVETPLASRP